MQTNDYKKISIGRKRFGIVVISATSAFVSVAAGFPA